MSNPVKKFEVEITPVGVWFSELGKGGKPLETSALYVQGTDLDWDVNELTKQLQMWFNF